MQLQTFDLFTINADAYYTSLEPEVDKDIDVITESSMTDSVFAQKTIDIFDKHYVFNEFEIIDVDKGIVTEHLDDDAATTLSGDSFAEGTHTSPVTEIWYDLEVKSGLLSVHQTVQYPKTTVKGAIKGSLIRLQFHFLNDDTTLIGPIALQEKERFIELVKANNQDLKRYFDSKKVLFQAQIKTRIQDKVAQNKKKEDERANF